jgi:hypothetical protein
MIRHLSIQQAAITQAMTRQMTAHVMTGRLFGVLRLVLGIGATPAIAGRMSAR